MLLNSKIVLQLLQIRLDCHIDWKIDNFLSWADTKAAGYRKKSPVFTFDFPALKKSYVFQLVVQPKGAEGVFRDDDDVGVYLRNNNSDTLHIKMALSLLNSAGREDDREAETYSFTAKTSKGFDYLFSRTELAEKRESLLPGGCLQIRCDFTIILPGLVNHVSQLQPCPEVNSCLLNDDSLSDFEIVCGSQTFPCHKAVLANKSPVLKTMMTSGRWAENEKNVLEISDVKPAIVKDFLNFIYTDVASEKCSIQ
jgi:hypothetical protein